MESPSAGQLSPKGSHTVTYTELVCNGANYNQASLHYKHCIQEAETVLSNRDEITNTLRQHIEKLEELYKKVVYQSEENRLKYWMAIQELENCKRFQKLYQQNSNKYCSKEITVNLCSSNHKQTKENPVLPLHHEIFDTKELSAIKDDQYVLIKKALSVQDVKLQFTLEKNKTGVCSCNHSTTQERNKRSSKEEKEVCAVDVKDSIIKKLKQENDTLKEHIAVLKQDLCDSNKEPATPNPTIIDNDSVLLRGKGVSFIFLNNQSGENQNIGDTTPLEMKHNVLSLENTQLKADLAKALESLQKQQKEMETIKEESIHLIEIDVTEGNKNERGENKSPLNTNEQDPDDESISNLNSFYKERIDEIYHQNQVNSQLINEIFWQLQQMNENTKSLRKLLETRSPPQPVVEKTVRSSLQQDKMASEDSLVDLLMGNDKRQPTTVEDQDTCDVATNCFTFCGCETETVKSNNRHDAETSKSSISGGRSSFRSTEIKEENLDVSTINGRKSSLSGRPEYYYVDKVTSDVNSKAACLSNCDLKHVHQ